MPASVHILATCRTAELLPATLLVFRTLRVGFPTAQVFVYGNGLNRDAECAVSEACSEVKAEFTPLGMEVFHDQWIERLVDVANVPFWICDTDMVFFAPVEHWTFKVWAGRYEPAFLEPWSRTQKVERLHTSLLWINGPELKVAMRNWIGRWHPKGFPFAPEINLIRQAYVPQGALNPPLFYDTCAGLFQAIGGEPFSEEQNAAFEHLHCGTYSDRISGALPGITDVHKSVLSDPNNARGLYQEQMKYYANH